MAHASLPTPPGRRGPGLVVTILGPAVFFLLGCLATWLVLQARPSEEVAASSAPAEPAAPAPSLPEAPAAPTVFRDNRAEMSQGAAALAGAGGSGGAFLALALVRGGEQGHLWKVLATESALPLDEAYLRKVIDGQPLAMLPSYKAKGKRGQVPDLEDLNDFEALSFCDALIKANLTSVGAFANSARRDLTMRDLFTAPGRYRGEVVHHEGLLRRVYRSDPPPNARARGVDHLYEGWVLDPESGMSPVCLVFTELPPGLTVAEKMNRRVSFDAYFFKKYRYESEDSKPGYVREAPLFVGRSPVLTDAAPRPALAPGWSTPLLVGFLVVLLATVVLALGLHFWFRRGDRKVRERLKGLREREFVDPGSPGLPGPTPSAN